MREESETHWPPSIGIVQMILEMLEEQFEISLNHRGPNHQEISEFVPQISKP